MKKINRLEIMDDLGQRRIVEYSEMHYDIQDDGKTIKIWMETPNELAFNKLSEEDIKFRENFKKFQKL